MRVVGTVPLAVLQELASSPPGDARLGGRMWTTLNGYLPTSLDQHGLLYRALGEVRRGG